MKRLGVLEFASLVQAKNKTTLMIDKIWAVHYADIVIKKDIPALDSVVKEQIKAVIQNKLLKDPIHFGKPLRHSPSNVRSLRVGKYRILYIVDNNENNLSIVAIGHRKDIYDKVK